MIKEVKMYSVVCDRCGKTFGEDDGVDALVDECTAKEQAMESEWAEIGDKFFFTDSEATEIYSLALHAAVPI